MKYIKYIDTPVGILSITADDKAINRLDFGKILNSAKEVDTPLLLEAERQIRLYFAGKLKEFDLPLESSGTDFQKSAWDQLKKIPYGKTASYYEQAANLGNPKAMRAVGGANGKNPISIIVPCHRVIGKSGSLTGFGGGLKNKEFLLAHEAKYAS